MCSVNKGLAVPFPSPTEVDRTRDARSGRRARWAARAGFGLVLFFLIKGLAWLAVPAVLAWWAYC